MACSYIRDNCDFRAHIPRIIHPYTNTMQSIIENETLKAVIDHKGAELVSLFSKETGLEYMWSGNPSFWGKHSPVLFPIVGALRENTYYYKNQSYILPRHGFARERIFSVDQEAPGQIGLLLEHDEETLAVYPFLFDLKLSYHLDGNSLSLTYKVKNRGDMEMLFSIGGHPAFRVPLGEGSSYSDYFLEFEKVEDAPRWPISLDGLIGLTPHPLLENTNRLPLTKELFAGDAIVFKHPASVSVMLRSSKHAHGWKMEYPGFPYLGIWAAKGADFVCVEPWCGIADSVNTDQQLKDKEGINRLMPGETFTRTWMLSVY